MPVLMIAMLPTMMGLELPDGCGRPPVHIGGMSGDRPGGEPVDEVAAEAEPERGSRRRGDESATAIEEADQPAIPTVLIAPPD